MVVLVWEMNDSPETTTPTDTTGENSMKLGYAFEIAITTQDLDRSAEFYERLGYQKLNDASSAASDKLLTDGLIRLRLRQGSTWKASLVYYAESVKEAAEQLEKLGVKIVEKSDTGDQMPAVSFTDPNGLEVTLVQLEQSRLVLPSGEPVSSAGKFGELSIETEDLERSLDFWTKLGFEPTQYMPNPPDTWGSIADGLLMLGLYKKGHLPHMISTPTITYFEEDMPERIRKLKAEGMAFVQEMPGAGGETGHAIAQAPEGQLIFLFGF
jgi:predicted enzyme related to lactoylglutathione lyase